MIAFNVYAKLVKVLAEGEWLKFEVNILRKFVQSYIHYLIYEFL